MPAQTGRHAEAVTVARRYLDAAAEHLKVAVDQPSEPFADVCTEISRAYRRMVNCVDAYPGDAEAAEYLDRADRLLIDLATNPAAGRPRARLDLVHDVINQAWATGRVNGMAARAEVP